MYLYVLLLSLPALALSQASLKPYDQTAATLFAVIDTDMNDWIDNQEIKDYYKRYDKNGDGRVTRQEFSAEIDAESPNFVGHEGQMFDALDIDTNNVLTESDFVHVFDVNDFNSDGVVTRDEFMSFWVKVFEAFEN